MGRRVGEFLVHNIGKYEIWQHDDGSCRISKRGSRYWLPGRHRSFEEAKAAIELFHDETSVGGGFVPWSVPCCDEIIGKTAVAMGDEGRIAAKTSGDDIRLSAEDIRLLEKYACECSRLSRG